MGRRLFEDYIGPAIAVGLWLALIIVGLSVGICALEATAHPELQPVLHTVGEP